MKKSIIGICFVVIVIIGIVTFNVLSIKGNLNTKDESGFKNLNGKNIIKTTSISDKLLEEDFPNLVKNSDSVIKGKVSSVGYKAIDGNAWTVISFKVDDVFKGSISKGDTIDVYYIGGYIDLNDHIKYYNDAEKFSNLSEKEINNTVLQEIVDGEEFIRENEELILCIVKTSDESPLPKGSYERLYSSGMLKLKDGKYTQVYGEVKEKYSIANDKLNNIKELVKK